MSIQRGVGVGWGVMFGHKFVDVNFFFWGGGGSGVNLRVSMKYTHLGLI